MRFRRLRNVMEEMLSSALQLWQAMLLHIKPKQLALFTMECICLGFHILQKLFILQEHY